MIKKLSKFRFLILLTLFITLSLPITSSAKEGAITYEQGKVVEKNEQRIIVELSKNRQKIIIPFTSIPEQLASFIDTGSTVMLSKTNQPNGGIIYFVSDIIRTNQLVILFFIFFFSVLVVTKKQGLLAFLGMLFTLFITNKLILPQIALGSNPLVVSLLAILLIIPVIFLLGHGVNIKTLVAMISTFISLLLTATLASIAIEITKLTGFSSEEAFFLQIMSVEQIDFKNLLLAGIVIGSLGILDDITISQTSLVFTLWKTNTKLSFKDLYSHAMSVGHDHISSLVNTLVLVYAGASLPLFLIFQNQNISYSTLINHEIIAVEIVRTLVASIGLVLTVPITTFISCLAVKKYS